MASTNLFLIFAFAAAISTVSATEFWVGGSSSWTIDVDYQAWAADKVFHVGDTLVFSYNKDLHNVFKVNGTEFQQCIKPDGNALASGHDVVTLATPGKKWYICGKSNHCADHKQKLVITVDDGAPAPSPDAGAGFATSPFNVLIAAAVALGIMAFM